ncbi:ornithine cyclodeaminase family protein [Hydrogenophaga sp.]|uniref:ornithine cyclodeaminase family protein n=1 Tax=Hydrogenophaga sp. TaxID=1904254 RepID=UPI0035AFF10E
MQFFDADATRTALPFDRLIPALRERFAGGCEAPARHVHDIVNPLGEAGQDAAGRRVTSLIMPAWIPGKHYGVKIVNIAPGNARRGLPGLHATYLLFDARTGVPLAQMDGDVITARRTAAASALAGTYLAREQASHLVLVGAGRVARLLPAAWKTVRPIEHVTVWARRESEAQALAAQLQHEGFSASATRDLASACAAADIVSCATMANEPVVRGSWLAPGAHLDLIGSFTPAMREADDACFEQSRVFVDTDEALEKSGDLLVPMQHGVFSANEIRGTLTTLARGVATGRKSPGERTVFKSVGNALEDLAAAVLVSESAAARA